MKAYTKLECVVRPQPVKGNKLKAATEIAIFIGPMLIASKVMGGNYTQEQGLAEFKRHPHTFTKFDGFDAALRLAA